MRFGSIPVGKAEGTILAHSLKADQVRFKKGRILDASDISHLSEAAVETVTVAVLDHGDVPENKAAACLGAAMAGGGLTISEATTGRVNVFAAVNGLFRADKALVDRLNRIDPAITFACLADHTVVDEGTMVATVKIIPLAVPGAALEDAVRSMSDPELASVRSFRALSVGLVATTLPTLKPSVMDKTARLLEERLQPSGSRLTGESRVPHETEVVAEALKKSIEGNDLVILFGASAVVDAQDVIPAAIRACGGIVHHVGMPVDPGNLLVLGQVGDVAVIGAPGCARSPKENGFDWVLARVLAGEMPTPHEITGMGVGGLLTEIASRPQPRIEKPAPEQAVETVLLAAGRASRMGEANGHKLLALFNGEPLVRRMARLALESGEGRVHVVVGYREDAVRKALAGLDVDIVRNPDFAAGMATSLATGVAGLSKSAGGVMILLADMPGLGKDHLNRLADAFHGHGGRAIVRACHDGKRGNPVILPRAAFGALARLSGDKGARPILDSGDFDIVDIEIGEAARLDVDTPSAVVAAGGLLETEN